MVQSERKPWHLNGRQVAEWLGLSTKTVSDRDYPKTRSGREAIYDIREVIGIDAVKGLALLSDDGETIDINYQRARLTKAQAGLAELTLASEQGRLRPVEEVEEAILAALTPVVGMLDSLPLAIKRECPELSHTAVEQIERTIATARNQLADEDVMTPSEAA